LNPKIYIAFRFHANFYHSYRGDTPDELGFGKDIRIIRHILKVLDEYNLRGIPVSGTWDFENYFSLEKIMPAHCPDIVESLQRRVRGGMDEMQFMSYNNGLINAHTAREFQDAMVRARTNNGGSGLKDLFGDAYENMVRPQEMMFSPIHLKLYKSVGIDSISLYYSSIPFNGFSNFIPLLSTGERYNPLTLRYPGIDETMTLLPAYNVGDLADHITLRGWVKSMRRQQLAMEEPCDLLLLIDQDADDEFWFGFNAPKWLKTRFNTIRGLAGLIDDVLNLDYVRFTTPGRYLKGHPAMKTIQIGQDTADGSYDGLSSWVEKWSNHRLFTGLERARILDLQTRRLAGKGIPGSIQTLIKEAFEARLKVLSTTHFGMAAPVMNLTRERIAKDLVELAVNNASTAFTLAAADPAPGNFCLVDYTRGESTDVIEYQAHPSQALIRLSLKAGISNPLVLGGLSGVKIPSVEVDSLFGRQLVFIDHFVGGEEKQYSLKDGDYGPTHAGNPVIVGNNFLQNEYLRVDFDDTGQLMSLYDGDREISTGQFFTSGVTYGGRTLAVESWQEVLNQNPGLVGVKIMRGTINLTGGFKVLFERETLLAEGMPYLYVNMRIMYPRTPDREFNSAKAKRLQQAWDERWQEVMPCQITPALSESHESPLRVWKHDYCDHVSTFDLNYGRFSPNKELSSVNNQITHAWVAVSGGGSGLLIAQNADVASNVAFCPLRVRRNRGKTQLHLNPFGSYSGRQYRYATATTNLGNLLASTFSGADHLKPYAPSYNGRVQEFSLMLAPYIGDAPPENIRYDAEAFAYPYIVLNGESEIADPPHRAWDGSGLGERLDEI
jgi:hypothetical protein